MRKIILVAAAMVLASASAQAGGPRGLSLASTNEQASAPQTTATTSAPTQVSEAAPAAEAPKYLDRPPAISLTAPAATAPTTTMATSAPAAIQPAAKADKPKHKRSWTEGRIIGELHRHGIYW
ncbi:hypothetical protein ABIB06_002820 [Bradyrhizobium sp. LB8.2]|jgi:hypothetical protein|uniref:hypothetical protein n=1 Tax=unclassified Bradyrhizobium TaxID=2631580 RepID=UPI001FF9B3FB|nr:MULTISPECIES: hypothetical protein [unclassified Bradyrhizobium]MCK1340111.1 hypothetical protein [Bradyrhizobium sp. 38]MCK1782031.1 hypothetical protein [Bradyrhizobium sp. 132]